MVSAYVSEIYPTIQGEGPYTGDRQIFLRLAGCPVKCRYCDTPESLEIDGVVPLSVDDVKAKIDKIRLGEGIDVVSVTGGEPLVQSEFLQVLLPALKEKGMRVYLETAGVDAQALASLVEHCDVIAMDIKLPSAVDKSFWAEHAAFLSVGKGKIFVKVVIEKDSLLEELEQAIALLEKQDPIPHLILQPVTPQGSDILPPQKATLDSFAQLARKRLPQVTIMEQQHKVMGYR